MDYGFVPQGRKLTFTQPDGKPAMAIYGLVRADSRAKVSLSYVVPHDSTRGYVVSRDVDELDQMAAVDFAKQEPPNRPDLYGIATEPRLTVAQPEPQKNTQQSKEEP